MARLATLLVVCVLTSACAAPTSAPTASLRSLPSRAVIRAAFERLGVTFHERVGRDSTTLLEATAALDGSGDRAFNDVQIVGDPVTAVVVNLPEFAMDSAGRFPGSALIDVMDSFDPGIKGWFVAQLTAESRDHRLEGLGRELDLNGLVAQIPATHLPGISILVVETLAVPMPSS